MKMPGRNDRFRFALTSSTCLAVLIFVGIVAYMQKPALPPELVETPILPLSRSPWLNVDPSVKKIGSDRCAECHQDEWDAHQKTSHGRSMARADPASEPPDAEFTHSNSD